MCCWWKPAAVTVEHAGRTAISRIVDVRDYQELQSHIDDAAGALGPIDIVSVNAGIFAPGVKSWELDPGQWREVIDINLTGAFNTARAVVPQVLQAGNGGSIVFTSYPASPTSSRSFGPTPPWTSHG